MMPCLTGAAARSVVTQIRPKFDFSRQEPVRAWGPVVAYQYDSAGARIQRYVTVLIQRGDGEWMLLRQVSNLVDGDERPANPIEMKISPEDARRWLADVPLSAERRM